MKLNFEIIDNTKGFLDREEGIRIYETAMKAGKLAPCLEIGSYCGKSGLYIGTACKENNTVLFSIDHHNGSEEQQPGEEYFDSSLIDRSSLEINTLIKFKETIQKAELEDTIIPIVAKSKIVSKFWRTPLSFVFIDGGHSYEAAYSDYNGWVSHIIPGGYLLIHDIFDDPKKGGQAPYNVYKLALVSGLFEELPMTKTLGVLKRIIF
ncbi:MAG: class I SAM-dependent methyltransferase [Desulfobacterales bacterium]|nr:class I SAM-dependent methyltransferase [Desulfobacterales bacterium]